jgi:NAD(P)-dependent dehydrogenase (short-subunit alcohol dehydrogenase family)
MDLNGVAAIVTGGASGLGEATARRLTAAGARVAVVDLQDDRGEQVAKELEGLYVRADVTSPDDVTAAVEAAAELGTLRVLVNCAGIGLAQRTIGRDGSYESAHPLDGFQRVISVNLIGTFNCIRIGATAISRAEPLDDGERGAIVNTASIAAFDGQIGQAAYSASKGGIVGMTLPIARDLAAAGIRVNTIAPGIMDTPLLGLLPDDVRAALGAGVLFPKRLGMPEEFAELALHLLTNPYVNGEVVRLDGGLRMPPR